MSEENPSWEEALPRNGEIDSVSDNAGAGPDLQRSRRVRQRQDTRIDRLPPHDSDAERGIIGCALLSPRDALPQIIARFGDREVLYDLRHETIVSQLIAMFEQDMPVDMITFTSRLRMFDMLEQIGGIPYLNDCENSVPSAANLPTYLDIVQEKYEQRRMIQVCTETVQRVYEHQGENEQLIGDFERQALQVRLQRQTESRGARELVHASMAMIEQYYQRQGVIGGIPTGFCDLDRMTDGMHGGEMITIAARPSMGKTSLAMNIAENVILQQNLPVGVFSLEMTAESLMTRMICSNARVNLRNVRDGFLAERDLPRLASSAGRLASTLLRVDDMAGLSIQQIRARARAMWQQYGIRLLIIDYLQLSNSTSESAKRQREREISEISGGCKCIAKELNIPVIVLSQMNRDFERDKNRKPRLADLRESGSIEQDSDVVGFLYKTRHDDDDDVPGEEPDGIPVNLLIAKQRQGPVGDIRLVFLKNFTRFESAARVCNDDDVPPERQEQMI